MMLGVFIYQRDNVFILISQCSSYMEYSLVLTSAIFPELKRLYENIKAYIEKEEQEDKLEFIKLIVNNLEGLGNETQE